MNYFGNLLVDFEVSLFRRDRLRNDRFFELTYLIWRNLRSDSISVTITWKTGVTSKIQSLHQIVHLKKLTSKINHIEKFLIDFEFTHFSKWSISKWRILRSDHFLKWLILRRDPFFNWRDRNLFQLIGNCFFFFRHKLISNSTWPRLHSF